MPALPSFTDADSWKGGSFEVAIEYDWNDLAGLKRALQAIWSFPSVQGCYLAEDIEPASQKRWAIAELSDDQLGFLYGIATLPNGATVLCHTSGTWGEYDPQELPDIGSRWLWFGLPMGSLSAAYPVGGYPIDDDLPSDWVPEVSGWLEDVALQVFQAAPFLFGIVGHEVGMIDEESADWLRTHGVPSKRWGTMLEVCEGEVIRHPLNILKYSDRSSRPFWDRWLRRLFG